MTTPPDWWTTPFDDERAIARKKLREADVMAARRPGGAVRNAAAFMVLCVIGWVIGVGAALTVLSWCIK